MGRSENGTKKNEMRGNLEKEKPGTNPRFSGRTKCIRSSKKGWK